MLLGLIITILGGLFTTVIFILSQHKREIWEEIKKQIH